MKFAVLAVRNLVFFWRTNLAIVAGMAVAVAVLSGALVVGRSVRGSLRDLLYERIGRTGFTITSDRFFTETLAGAEAFAGESCPIVYVKGIVVREKSDVRAHDVNVYGVDERFWTFHGAAQSEFTDDRAAAVGRALARQLDLREGDALLLRVEAQQTIPREWLYGRRENLGRTMRLNCGKILPSSALGEFALRPSQGEIFSIFVPLKRLQKDLGQPERVNTLLISGRDPDRGIDSVRKGLKKSCTLADLGLKLRPFPSGGGFSLESSRIIMPDAVARAGLEAATSAGLKAAPVYAYLANRIRVGDREIPYSVIVAADIGTGAMASVSIIRSSPTPPDEPIWLTDWAATDLEASPGDPVEIEYYRWEEAGQLATRSAHFRLAGIVATSGDVNASLAPEIPGITDAQSMTDWDPPFPLDLSRIRPKDEEYWNRYRATPKAFIPSARGRMLWGNRFGDLTALRIAFPGVTAESGAEMRFTSALLERLDPEQAGLSVHGIRSQGLAASRGSVDFGEYFLYFSSFLVGAAILFSALVFQLMIEQRSREIGTLRAAGFAAAMVRRIFLLEGACLSIIGSILGMLAAIGFGWLMVLGLRTWWVDAVGTRRLLLHFSWQDLLIGACAGTLISLTAILWTLRGLQHNSPRMLLGGVLETATARSRRDRALAVSAAALFAAAALLLTASAIDKIPPLEGFFGSGFLLLISILCATSLYLRRGGPNPIRGSGWTSLMRLGLRNAMHRPARSLVCAILIASATFIIISMEGFRRESSSLSLDPASGTGGYPLIARAAIPIVHDPDSGEGREALGLLMNEGIDPGKVRFLSFRERPGDDASCLNLYAPQEPRILGAPGKFLHAGRFSFQKSLAATDKEKANPWLLLENPSPDGAIPAIADASTVQYILQLSLGSELTVPGHGGKPFRLRLVAALRDSIFQGEILISEQNFLRAFPEQEGFRFFLIDVPPAAAEKYAGQLQEGLSDWGLRIESSGEKLHAYHRVENAYLSAFQSLGTLGLILGTFGLGAVLLRNVLERRKEIALMAAVGYRKGVLSMIIIAENAFLMCWGLAAGTTCALLAILPALKSMGESFPFATACLILASILAAGLLSSTFAMAAALRSPLLASLRSE
jgi:ABC-type lipoprotein release transport system permease subunit